MAAKWPPRSNSDQCSISCWGSIISRTNGWAAKSAHPCGAVAELTDVPTEASDCVLQEPTQIGLQGRADYPGSYELKRLRVEHLRGVTHVEPPRIGFEVRGTPEVVGWRLR
jgi:hypothetical protein